MRVPKEILTREMLKSLDKTYVEIAKESNIKEINIRVLGVENRYSQSRNTLEAISKSQGKDFTWLSSGDGKWN